MATEINTLQQADSATKSLHQAHNNASSLQPTWISFSHLAVNRTRPPHPQWGRSQEACSPLVCCSFNTKRM